MSEVESTTENDVTVNEDISKEELLLQATLLSIENDSIDDVKVLVEKMPIFRMDPPLKVELLVSLLEKCQEYNRQEIARQIIYIFDQADKIEDDSIFYDLFGDRSVSDKTLYFLSIAFLNFKETDDIISWADIMDVFIKKDDSPDRIYACYRVTLVYGEKDYDSYVAYRDIADQEGAFKMMIYMNRKIQESSPYIDNPDYVQDFTDGNIPTDIQIIARLPDPIEGDNLVISLTPEEAANALTAGVKQAGFTIDDEQAAYNQIFQMWPRLSETDKRVMLEPVLKIAAQFINADNTNLNLFRLMGPSNPFVGNLIDDQDDLCSQYGCRMLYCNCLGNRDLETGYVYKTGEYDWFIRPNEDMATCDECSGKMRNRAQALRLPHNQGGWLGRFCSEKCALQHQAWLENVPLGAQGRDEYRRQLFALYLREITTIGLQYRN